LWVAPELSYPVGPVEVREREDVEQLGASSWGESVETLL
jgi:hypothetical protein